MLRPEPRSAAVHFACHADGSPTNPSAAHLPQAVLAYLSACGTVTLTDEAITVAGRSIWPGSRT
jgi:hypothetical protein